METYATSIIDESMQMDDDGTYYGTILASRHGLGDNAFVVRAVHRNSSTGIQENVLCSYKTLSNGDIRVYVDEPVSLRVTLGRGDSVIASIAGEGEEHADT